MFFFKAMTPQKVTALTVKLKVIYLVSYLGLMHGTEEVQGKLISYA